MTINLPGIFTDAWSMFRRHQEVLMTVAGMFIFLPTLALLLLVPVAPPWPDSGATEPEIQAGATKLAAWIVDNTSMFAAAAVASLYGALAISVFLLDPGCADLRAAMARALKLLPRYILAALLILVPASLGLFVLILPGIYILGRTMLIGPTLIVERPIAATAAIMRSIALTRGNGLVLAGLTGIGLVAGQILPAPFQRIEEALRIAEAANPVMIAIVDSAAAACAAAVTLATILVRIAVYRQLASRSGT
ncbi:MULTISPECIES: hypothetical protein [unclassified Sphingomonas]|uniref:hypothetical protein n=1 Tax=unclassified Sphingomonas TaxID=196159 RepID=UPI0026C40ECA